MSKRIVLPMVLTTTAAIIFAAASPLGSVSCAGPIEINGTKFSASSVSSWPVVVGDVIVTSKLPGVVFLKDKSRVILEPNSRVRMEVTDGRTVIRLLQGNLSYSTGSRPVLSFLVGTRRVTPAGGSQASLSASPATKAASNGADFGTGNLTGATVPVPSNVSPF